jgi:hypothetical protein
VTGAGGLIVLDPGLDDAARRWLAERGLCTVPAAVSA